MASARKNDYDADDLVWFSYVYEAGEDINVLTHFSSV